MSPWSLLHYELVSFDNHPITVGKLLVAFVLIVLGSRIARWTSSRLAKKVLPRFGLQPGEAAAFQALVYYGLIVATVLLALTVVHVPLTIFTLLGGAIAIGVGFGSQNIINNFFSGLIILVERPIRVGDIVEIEGRQGQVLTIGARSTKIVTGSNTTVIVPNSVFLEKNVVNWTLGDERIRGVFTVGISYGSDIKLARKILLQVAETQHDILAKPAPAVVIADLSEKAMVFQLQYWFTTGSTVSSLSIESELREQIVELFHNAGITFPQPAGVSTAAPAKP